MKFLFLIILSFLSLNVLAKDLSGVWYDASEPHGKPIRFIKFKDTFQFTGKEKFVFENGSFSHSIDQTVKLKFISENEIEGSIDVFDSRGCTFKNLPAVGEFQNDREVSFILTYPRYNVVKITTGPTNPYYRNVYCTNSYGYQYICGRERVKPSVRYECKLIENVEVPVLIRREKN
jgi:hypothetical protein